MYWASVYDLSTIFMYSLSWAHAVHSSEVPSSISSNTLEAVSLVVGLLIIIEVDQGSLALAVRIDVWGLF